MPELEFTKISSKGQVVIPQDIRESLGLEEGTPLAVAVRGSSVVLKKVELPKVTSWKEVAKPFRAAAKEAGFAESDLNELIAEVRAFRK